MAVTYKLDLGRSESSPKAEIRLPILAPARRPLDRNLQLGRGLHIEMRQATGLNP